MALRDEFLFLVCFDFVFAFISNERGSIASFADPKSSREYFVYPGLAWAQQLKVQFCRGKIEEIRKNPHGRSREEYIMLVERAILKATACQNCRTVEG